MSTQYTSGYSGTPTSFTYLALPLHYASKQTFHSNLMTQIRHLIRIHFVCYWFIFQTDQFPVMPQELRHVNSSSNTAERTVQEAQKSS